MMNNCGMWILLVSVSPMMALSSQYPAYEPLPSGQGHALVKDVGNTNCLCRVAWFLTCHNQERTLWQKICAITMLSTGNKNATAAEYFNVATNTLQYWDAHTNCFSGGELYQSIARYFGASELNSRICLVFAAAISAKKAGMTQQFSYYSGSLPLETRKFLIEENG